MRELEGLAAPDLAPLWSVDPANPVTSTQFKLNGLLFHYDGNAGQKTGAFLDQRANYLGRSRLDEEIGRLMEAALSTSAPTRGDSHCISRRFASTVTGIDASRTSLEVAERNLAANRVKLTAEVDWVEADAFQILRDWSDAGETFDAIVLDPPAFAKTKRAVEGALRGYKELNLRALRMVRPGRPADHLLVQPSRGLGRPGRRCGLRRGRCAPAGAPAGAPRRCASTIPWC